MATAVASRFAVLPDDVDDDYSSRKKKPPVKKVDAPKTAPTGNKNNDVNKKKKNNKENSQAPKSKQKNGNAGSQKKKKEPTVEDWEKWKQKDEQLLDGAFEEDLTEAILLSKLDFEEKKEFYDQQAKMAEQEKKPEMGRKNRKNTKVLTVEEFMNLGKPKPPEGSPVKTFSEPLKQDPTFFDKVKDDVKKELNRETVTPKKAVRIPFDEQALTLAQVRDQLDKKRVEVSELKEENTRLKEELINVKTRNKKLCQILANGEMKDKAEVLIEVEKLERARIELSEEIASLNALLEQERSKVRALSAAGDSKTKDKNKKRTTSSGDQ